MIKKDNEIRLSVVIPTRNRCDYLKDALDSIVAQTLSKDLFEVIVVDNGSTDPTQEVVKSFEGKLPYISCIYEPKPGLHEGRHAGYRAAKSDILVYADDDIIAFPTWLEGVFESFQDENVVLVGGKDLPKYEGEVPFWIKEKWYELCPYGHSVPQLSLIDFGDEVKEINPLYVYGCNFAVRKWVIEKAGGFMPDGMPWEKIEYRGSGESYISAFVGCNYLRTIYNPKASIWHRVPKSRLTVDYFKKWYFSMAISASYAALRKQPIEILDTSKLPLKKRLKRHVRQIVGDKMIKWIKSFRKNKPLDLSQLTDLEREFIKSQNIGYAYHQEKYKTDPELREWVHRKTYM